MREAYNFPSTVFDAIEHARRLHLPYLSLDLLCIIQDSKADKYIHPPHGFSTYAQLPFLWTTPLLQCCHTKPTYTPLATKTCSPQLTSNYIKIIPISKKRHLVPTNYLIIANISNGTLNNPPMQKAGNKTMNTTPNSSLMT